MSLKVLDIVFALCLVALGSYIIIESLSYGYIFRNVPGPGYFPFWTGVILVSFSLINLFRGIRQTEFVSQFIGKNEIIQVVMILLCIMGYIFISQKIGMIYSTIIFIITCGLILKYDYFPVRFLIKISLVSFATTVITVYIFRNLLSVPIF